MAIDKIKIFFILLLTVFYSEAQQAELSIQTGHTAAIMKLCYSPNGKILASSDIQNKIILWDMETGGQMVKFFIDNESENDISALTFSKKGNYLIAGTKSGFVYIFDIAASKLLNKYQFSSSITNLTFSEKNEVIYVLADKLFSLNILNLALKQINEKSFVQIARQKNGTYFLIDADSKYYLMSDPDSALKEIFSKYSEKFLKKKKDKIDARLKKLDDKKAATPNEKKKGRIEMRKSLAGYFFYRNRIAKAVFSDDGNTSFTYVTGNYVKATSLVDGKNLFVRASTYFDETFT